jgi:hypothetical protein
MRSLQRLLTLAVASTLGACGIKEKPAPKTTGPQSTEGQILEAVQNTVDAANERSRKVAEDLEKAAE